MRPAVTSSLPDTSSSEKQSGEEQTELDLILRGTARLCEDVGRIRRKVEQLPSLERRVLDWTTGLDSPPLEPWQIALKLGITEDEVEALERAALASLAAVLEARP
jgi:DNA-directed RNA polymerase specialized sigma24 family protein